ncbi:hypothetical protein MRB53_016224 [Persea americana]|uniref:Uncharacterized protein n=1 Tax=Persea americana TaxID=3435 RepID=A0ACC2M1L1_PERAE|nr:hypothetical protein MRB53_016224 [Persea americana]
MKNYWATKGKNIRRSTISLTPEPRRSTITSSPSRSWPSLSPSRNPLHRPISEAVPLSNLSALHLSHARGPSPLLPPRADRTTTTSSAKPRRLSLFSLHAQNSSHSQLKAVGKARNGLAPWFTGALSLIVGCFRTVLLVYYLPCSQFWAVAGVVTVLNSGIYIVLVFCCQLLEANDTIVFSTSFCGILPVLSLGGKWERGVEMVEILSRRIIFWRKVEILRLYLVGMYKNQLQELAQRSCFNLPSYACIREGPDHAPRFKATVNFNGEIFEGPSYCFTLRQAEHAAAEVALHTLSTRGPSRCLAARVLVGTGDQCHRGQLLEHLFAFHKNIVLTLFWILHFYLN